MSGLRRIHPGGTHAAGFTLIELMTVLVILSILAYFMVTQLGSADEAVNIKLVRADMERVGVVLSSYESELGDYPSSTYPEKAGSPPNLLNVGAECLVLALFSSGRDGMGLSPDSLDNTDGDSSQTTLTDLPTRDLFEFVDAWGNPVAYFHRQDYGRTDLYTTFDPVTGALLESEVTAWINPKTKLAYNHRSFQLISAGPDGLFGTPDDVSNTGR